MADAVVVVVVVADVIFVTVLLLLLIEFASSTHTGDDSFSAVCIPSLPVIGISPIAYNSVIVSAADINALIVNYAA